MFYEKWQQESTTFVRIGFVRRNGKKPFDMFEGAKKEIVIDTNWKTSVSTFSFSSLFLAHSSENGIFSLLNLSTDKVDIFHWFFGSQQIFSFLFFFSLWINWLMLVNQLKTTHKLSGRKGERKRKNRFEFVINIWRKNVNVTSSAFRQRESYLVLIDFGTFSFVRCRFSCVWVLISLFHFDFFASLSSDI